MYLKYLVTDIRIRWNMTTIQQFGFTNRDVFRDLQELIDADEDLKEDENYPMQTIIEYPLNTKPKSVEKYSVLLDTIWDGLHRDYIPELIGIAASIYPETGYVIAILDKGLTQEHVDDFYGYGLDVEPESIEPIAEIFRSYNLVPGSFQCSLNVHETVAGVTGGL
jgi:hypothetical protein